MVVLVPISATVLGVNRLLVPSPSLTPRRVFRCARPRRSPPSPSREPFRVHRRRAKVETRTPPTQPRLSQMLSRLLPLGLERFESCCLAAAVTSTYEKKKRSKEIRALSSIFVRSLLFGRLVPAGERRSVGRWVHFRQGLPLTLPEVVSFVGAFQTQIEPSPWLS